jgi:hypothetical protein
MTKTLTVAFVLAAVGAREGPARATEPARNPAPQGTTKGPPMMKPVEATPADHLGSLPPGVGVAVGEKAPDALVADFEGREVRLATLLSRGPTLLVFYRGGWCPFCNFQIHELTAAYPQFKGRVSRGSGWTSRPPRVASIT